MKLFFLSFASILLACFSLNALADKIIIQGQPIVVEKQGEVYVPSSTVPSSTTTTSEDYYYFTIDNTKRVCYREVNPALVKVETGVFAVKLGNDVVNLHCYTYSPDYFVNQ